MKKPIWRILLFATCFAGHVAKIHAQEEITDTIIVFEDFYETGGSRFLPIDTLTGPVYPRRASEARGNIEYTITGNMPDSLQTAIQEAVDTWNKCLAGGYANLQFIYTDNINPDIQTEIPFLSSIVDADVYYTQSLHRYLFNSNNYQTYDAVIKINATEDWYIGISDYDVAKKNLSYAAKRAIALSMGFGSSIIKNNRGNIVFGGKRGHSITDHLIFNSNGTYLSSINNSNQKASQAITNFVTSNTGSLYIKQQDSAHGLYAPSTFDENKSLRYLTNANSIMYYDDSQILSPNIDNVTIEILKSIGWSIDLPDNVEIVGENIDSTGVTSAYTSHRFYLSPDNSNITSRQWEFRIALNNGLYQTISTANSQDFTISAIQDASNYKHTIDGCLLGEILFTGSINDETVNLKYQLTLRLRPSIISAECISVTPSTVNSNNYDILVGVKYEGSYWLTASARERGTSIAYTYHSNQPYYANIVLSNIRLWDETYVTVSATNQYGTGTQVLVIPAADDYELLSVGNPRRSTRRSTENTIKIKEVNLSYGSFNYSSNDFDDTKGIIRFVAPEFSQLVCSQWMEGNTFPYTWYENNYTMVNDSIVEINLDDWFWGDKYWWWIYKKDDGQRILSDTILVNDYLTITDPDIRAALGLPTSIHETKDDTYTILSNGNQIEVDMQGKTAKCLDLYTATGALVVRCQYSNNISISGLPHGLYLLCVTDEKNKKTTKKLRL